MSKELRKAVKKIKKISKLGKSIKKKAEGYPVINREKPDVSYELLKIFVLVDDLINMTEESWLIDRYRKNFVPWYSEKTNRLKKNIKNIYSYWEKNPQEVELNRFAPADMTPESWIEEGMSSGIEGVLALCDNLLEVFERQDRFKWNSDNIKQRLIDLKPKIKKVITLHKKVKDNSKRIREEIKNSSNENSEIIAFHNDEDYMNSQKELLDYLESLTDDELILIETVMYIGRPGMEVDETKLNLNFNKEIKEIINSLGFDLEDRINRDAEISQITSKSPLDEYLKTGMTVLGL